MKVLTRSRLFAQLLGFVFATAPYSVSAQTPHDPSLSLGIIMDVTGPAAPIGEDCRQGFELARHLFAKEDTIKGAPVRFVFGDSKGDQKTAVIEFSRMVDSEKAVAVLVSRTGLATAVNPISRQKKVPIVGITANPVFVDENKYAFRIWVRADQEGEALARKAAEKQVKRIAVLTAEEDYPIVMSKSFTSSFQKLGGEIVFDETIDKDFVDFSSLLPRLKARAPDAVFMNVTIPQLGIAYKRMHELGIKKQFFSSYFVFRKDVLETAGPESVEGAIAVEIDYKKQTLKMLSKLNSGTCREAVWRMLVTLVPRSYYRRSLKIQTYGHQRTCMMNC